MKKRVRITETDLKNTIKSILNELDWKTYANAAKKRLKQYNDTRDVDKFDRFYDLNKYANERFDDDFVGLMKYDTLGDSWRGKKSAKFDSRFDVGKKDRMPYGAVKGRNKSGDDIFSTEKGVYHSSKGITKPSTFFKDKEVADAYEKANDELWDYDLGNYEYVKGKGWVNKNELSESKVRRIVKESVKTVLKEMYDGGKDVDIEEFINNRHENWIKRGYSEREWNEEGVAWALQDWYGSCDFSEEDWKKLEKMGLDELAAWCNELN